MHSSNSVNCRKAISLRVHLCGCRWLCVVVCGFGSVPLWMCVCLCGFCGFMCLCVALSGHVCGHVAGGGIFIKLDYACSPPKLHMGLPRQNIKPYGAMHSHTQHHTKPQTNSQSRTKGHRATHSHIELHRAGHGHMQPQRGRPGHTESHN